MTKIADTLETTGRRPLTARYGLVLLVWLALFVVRPALALQILRERRADSPLPRLRPAAASLAAC